MTLKRDELTGVWMHSQSSMSAAKDIAIEVMQVLGIGRHNYRQRDKITLGISALVNSLLDDAATQTAKRDAGIAERIGKESSDGGWDPAHNAAEIAAAISWAIAHLQQPGWDDLRASGGVCNRH